VSGFAPLDTRTRRVLLLVSVIVLVDTSFYAAITPLLPYYADQLDLSKASAGVLTGAYAAGTVIASLPMAWLVSRIGARRGLTIGLTLLAISSLTFGLAKELWLLDAARFVQGVGGAATWTAGLALLTAVAPGERRAEVLGTAFAAAVGGALLGPIVGALGRALGTAEVFGAVAVIAVALLVAILRGDAFADPPGERRDVTKGFATAFRSRQILRGSWIVAVSGLAFGVLDVLLPLKMGVLGASGAVIALTFIGATALETAVARPVGRLADRGLSEQIALVGLMSAALLSLVASLPGEVAGLVIVGVAAGPLIGGLWIPGLAWLAEGSEQAGVEYAYAFGIQSFLWSGAQAIGSGAGGALAHSATDFVPYALVAAAAVGTAVGITRTRTRAPARAA
jgi:predicted MFS family arabinose efflux permease